MVLPDSFFSDRTVSHIKSVSIGIVNSSQQSTVNSQQSTVNSQQSTVNSQHHSGVTGNDIRF